MSLVVRETDISIIDKLEPMFIGDGEFTPAILAVELKVRMATDNDSVCIIVAYDKDEIVGFIICIEIPERHYLWLEQAYNKSNHSNISRKGMLLLNEWAKGTGKKEIRFETSPECPPDYIAHKVAKHRGFVEHSIIYSLRVQ